MNKLETEQKLRQAIADHAKACEFISDGDLLSQFVVVCHWTGMDDDTQGFYTTHDDGIPSHATLGLLMQGIEMETSTEYDDD